MKENPAAKQGTTQSQRKTHSLPPTGSCVGCKRRQSRSLHGRTRRDHLLHIGRSQRSVAPCCPKMMGPAARPGTIITSAPKPRESISRRLLFEKKAFATLCCTRRTHHQQKYGNSKTTRRTQWYSSTRVLSVLRSPECQCSSTRARISDANDSILEYNY